MEIICIDKRTFDELVVRFSMIEKKVTGICNPAKDAGLKNCPCIKQLDREVRKAAKRTENCL